MSLARPATGGQAAGTPRRWWLPAVVYTAGLAAAAALLAAAPGAARDRWVDWASTDLDNLARNPVGSMVASAFVTETDRAGWLALSLVGLAALGRRLGPLRATVAVLVAHVVGTLVSEGILAWRIDAGLVDPAARFAPDVGPSYVVAAALAAGLLVGRAWWRAGCALGLALLAPYLFDGIGQWQVAAVGHAVAIGTGLVGGLVLACRPARCPARPRDTRSD